MQPNTTPPTPDTVFFRSLREIAQECKGKANQHDIVPVLIDLCIEYGIDRGHRITKALATVGFNARFVGITLRDGTGNDPARHRWHRGEDGTYSVLRDAPVAAPAVSAAHISVPSNSARSSLPQH